MFGIGKLPTGDKDPFALRRHALGVVRMLVEKDLPLSLAELLAEFANWAFPAGGARHRGRPAGRVHRRPPKAGSLREEGYSAQEVDAVLALRPQRLGDCGRAPNLAAVRAFAALPEAPALAAANKRVGNILKKADREVDAHVSEACCCRKPPKRRCTPPCKQVAPQADAVRAGDYTGSLQALAALRAPVDAFFDGVMVNAEDSRDCG
jgi:glycyl-tRNA synthetase beta chain